MRVFTLYVGTRRSDAKETLLRLLREEFESFTVISGEGYFRGSPEPMWFVKIATEDPARLLDLAEDIRATLDQDGVGIEFEGNYYRCTAAEGASSVRARLQLQPRTPT